MRIKKAIWLLPVLAITLTTGCKIIITTPESGSVVTQSGALECTAANSPCTVNVIDTLFDENFIAQPAEGFEFSGWKKANRHFCGGSKNSCALNTAGFVGNALLLSFLDNSEQEFFIVPTFSRTTDLNASWSGTWETSNAFEAETGTISLDISNAGTGEYTVDLDLGGLIGGIMNPAGQSVVATEDEDGTISFTGAVDLGGESATLEFTLTAGGEVSIGIPDIPQAPFTSLDATGFLGETSGSLSWAVTQASGSRIKGEASVTRG